jgi:hypothetical protein
MLAITDAYLIALPINRALPKTGGVLKVLAFRAAVALSKTRCPTRWLSKKPGDK